jgi:TatD DNase family protein
MDSLTKGDGSLFHTRKGRPQPWPKPLAPLADTHCHLTVFEGHDPAEAICRAALVGCRLLVVPIDPTEDGTDAEAFLASLTAWLDEARALLARAVDDGLVPPEFPGHPSWTGIPDVRILAGTHPYGAAIHDAAARERLETFLSDPRCVGVGEIGLDYTCDVPVDVQLAVFDEQLACARERSLPVELHIRDERDDASHAAHLAAAELLAERGVPEAGCDLHCFTDDIACVRPFVGMGCHVAFGGAVTFSKSDDIRDAAAFVPDGLILSETDCPYMAPVPLRGEECEPAMVAFSAACVADVREEAGISSRKATYESLWHNACELFSIS